MCFPDYQITIDTSSWLITHTTEFRIGVPFKEMDLDGSDSVVRII